MPDIGYEGGSDINIVSADGNDYKAKVTAAGELNVITTPPTPPPGTNSQGVVVQQDVSGNQNVYTYFTIPNGETLNLQSFSGDAEGESRSKIELYHDPLGVNPTGSQGGNNIPASWVLIEVVYVGTGRTIGLDDTVEYDGDGDARIALRFKRLESGTREMFGKWTGYSQ